jgi:hypothetical protein
MTAAPTTGTPLELRTLPVVLCARALALTRRKAAKLKKKDLIGLVF